MVAVSALFKLKIVPTKEEGQPCSLYLNETNQIDKSRMALSETASNIPSLCQNPSFVFVLWHP